MKLLCVAFISVGLAVSPVDGQSPAPRDAARTRPQQARTPIRTDHLALVTYATDDVVAPGSPFSLVFEITPRPRMHVYAPGAEPYQVIRVRLDPNPLLTVRPPEYPPSEIYVFEPLDERVPVYQKAFALRQPLLVRAPERGRGGATEVTITGALEYQACDDRICFRPQSIPVSYTVRLK
jgi:hypothetical protein